MYQISNEYQNLQSCSKEVWQLVQWICRWWFLNLINVFLLFHYNLPWLEKGVSLHLNLNPLHPRMLCAKFVEISPVVLEEKIFKILLMYFCYFVISSPWRRGPSFEQTWILFNQGCFAQSSVEIGLVVLE